MTKTDDKPALLIVDDVVDNIQILGQTLEDRYEIRFATNGPDALQIVGDGQAIDLILLDIVMPQMDGYEVCRRLKQKPETVDIPIIFLSALESTDDKINAFSSGGVDYITKPFQTEEVLARIETHLKLRKLQVDLEDRNEKLQRSYDQLRKAEAMRDSLTHMIVHDLRSPLGGVKLTLQNLLRKFKRDESKVSYSLRISRAQSTLDMLLEMIDCLLDINKMEAGKLEINPIPTEVNLAISQALESLGDLTEHHDIHIDSSSSEARWTFDPELIRRVIANLVGNAIKFSPDGAPIAIRTGLETTGMLIEIKDSGPGIPADLQSKIFEKFGQAQAREQRQMHSTGLGLTFCKMAVEAHGGAIGVHSVPGEGSTFWFQLPSCSEAPSAAGRP